MIDQTKIQSYLEENNLDSIGKLSVILYVTDCLARMRFPYLIDEILTENQGQVKGLSGASVAKIMADANFPISPKMIGEAGRTSRGSVSNARRYVEWINENCSQDQINSGIILFIKDFLVRRLHDLIVSERRIYDALPTSDPNYIGPRFLLTENGLSLDDRTFSKINDLPAGILDEIRRIVEELNASLAIAGNCYSSLKNALLLYQSEILHPIDSLRIPVVYARGLEVEGYADEINKDGSEEPTLDSDRLTLVKTFRALHGILIASTEAGRELLSAAARYENHRINLSEFNKISSPLVKQAIDSDLIDEEAGKFITGVSSNIGAVNASVRKEHVAILSQRNAWSVLAAGALSFVIQKSLENSSYASGLFAEGGKIVDILIKESLIKSSDLGKSLLI